MQNSQGRTTLVRGRIVWTSGDLFKGQPRVDMNTKAPKLDAQGVQMTQYGFGLSIPKSEVQNVLQGATESIFQAMQAEVMSIYPTGQIPPSFAYKFKDGDGVDHNGKSFADREGYPGCYVFALTTNIPIKFFKYQEGIGNVNVNEGIKCGDEVVVQVFIKAHTAIGTSKPGMYLNPLMVQLWKVGEAIVNTPDANTVFGTAAPVGMNYSGPAVPQQSMMTAQAPMMSQQSAQPFMQQAPQAAPQPHYGVVPVQHQPQPPVQQQQPMMPQVPPMGNGAPPVMHQQPGYPQQPMGVPTFPGQAQFTGQQNMPGQPSAPSNGGGFPFPG